MGFLHRLRGWFGRSRRASGSAADDLAELLALDSIGRGPDEEEARVAALLAPVLLEHARALERELPPFPAVVLQVLAAGERGERAPGKLASLIAQGPALDADAVLRVLHGLGAPILNLRAAIAHVGARDAAQITAGVAARAVFDPGARQELALFEARWTRLFHVSMTVAFTAGWLAAQRKGAGTDRVFAAGMFHAVGQTLALRALGTLVLAGKVGAGLSERVIDRAIELVHVELGVAMMRAWSLPEPLTDDAGAHAVRLAANLYALRLRAAGSAARAEEVRASLQALRIDRRRFLLLDERLHTFAAEVSRMFGVPDPLAVSDL